MAVVVRKILSNLQDANEFGAGFVWRKLLGRRKDQPRPIATKHGTFHLRKDDMPVLRSIYAERCYDLAQLAQFRSIEAEYRRILSAGEVPVVIDAGANVGISSRFFSDLFPEAVVVAVEPDEENARIFRKNVAERSNIMLLPFAIGSRAGQVALDYSKGAGDSVRTRRAEQGVQVVTVQDLMASVENGRLFVAKIDIEGFENDLFSANTGWVDDAFVLIVEPHDWLLPGSGSSSPMQQVMLGRGRELVVAGENLIWIKTTRDGDTGRRAEAGEEPGALGQARRAQEQAELC